MVKTVISPVFIIKARKLYTLLTHGTSVDCITSLSLSLFEIFEVETTNGDGKEDHNELFCHDGSVLVHDGFNGVVLYRSYTDTIV